MTDRHPKNRTNLRSFDKVAADPRVVEIWAEGGPREDGYWISLADGYNAEGCSCVHGWTVRETLRLFRSYVEPGPTY